MIQIAREAIKEGKTAGHRKVESEFAERFSRKQIPISLLALSSESGPNEVLFLQAFLSFAAAPTP